MISQCWMWSGVRQSTHATTTWCWETPFPSLKSTVRPMNSLRSLIPSSMCLCSTLTIKTKKISAQEAMNYALFQTIMALSHAQPLTSKSLLLKAAEEKRDCKRALANNDVLWQICINRLFLYILLLFFKLNFLQIYTFKIDLVCFRMNEIFYLFFLFKSQI